ncbi:predicted protein [Nematostella vectensis]|uniref:Equilibrative nucleoside transporter 1 n=2 Tax=Nematostella vectensis TaxID=45351 RepID=A7SFF0_NEMVE|nr:predicted protein [Nematostella vectensis]|eukprot:XP_001629631.1 predicted protein [Nematostella vectensis]
MGAGKEGYTIESRPMLSDHTEKSKATLLVSLEPKDRFKLVYWIMLLQGIGTLLPWNMFITAHMYFTSKLKNEKEFVHSFENYFSVAAMVPNVIMFFLNTLFKHKVKLQTRMVTSLVLMTLLFVLTTVLVKIKTTSWTREFFYLTIATVIIVNMATAVYQGGLFGLSGMMPAKYTGAVMTGQGIGGTFAALASIIFTAIWGQDDPITVGFGYFLSAVVMLFLCIITYILLPSLNFARHFMGHSSRDQVDFPHMQHNQGSRIANWNIDPKKPGRFQSSLSLDASVNASTGTYLGVELESREIKTLTVERPPFFLIFKKIAPVGLSVAFVFFVTLAAFPSLTAKVKSNYTGDNTQWTSVYFTPVTCFLLFNVGDFSGRLLASLAQFPRRGSILLPIFCFVRVIFLPLFFFCNAQPRTTPVFFADDGYYIAFMALFGLTNGYLGSLCMMYGPGLVEPKHAETAGTMMAFLLIIGLALGAGFSFVLTTVL